MQEIGPPFDRSFRHEGEWRDPATWLTMTVAMLDELPGRFEKLRTLVESAESGAKAGNLPGSLSSAMDTVLGYQVVTSDLLDCLRGIMALIEGGLAQELSKAPDVEA